MKTQLAEVTYLHSAADGRVWGCSNSRLAEPLWGSLEELQNSSFPGGIATSFRLVGSRHNSELLTVLYYLKCRSRIGSLQVCSPLLAGNESHQNDVKAVLYLLRDVQHPASMGGWGELGPLQIMSYMLASCRGLDCSLVPRHPVWPSLSFVAGINISNVAKLIGLIIDPRFFVDPRFPDRKSKLESYLGLSCRNVNPSRLRLLEETWSANSHSQSDLSDPTAFVWRRYDKSGRRAASRYFLSYMVATWLDEMYRGLTLEPLFVPEHFFEDEETVTAWKKHTDSFYPSF